MGDNIKVGDEVLWLDSTYIVLKIEGKSLILKQNFSIGTILKGKVPIEEVVLKISCHFYKIRYIYLRNLGTKLIHRMGITNKITKT